MNTLANRFHVWSVIICLSISAFIFNTTEFLPIGLLPNIANNLSISITQTGFLVTIYAWCVSILSLPLAIMTANIERKKLLLFVFILFIISHILSGFAWDFYSLLVGRIGVACAHAIFWAVTTPLAVRLAPQNKQAQSMGLLVAGTSMATILGVPLGTMLGQLVGWRIAFLGIGGMAAIMMLFLIYLLPVLPSTNHDALAKLPALLKRPSLLTPYIMIALVAMGHFTAYVYITPFLCDIAHISEHIVAVLLLCVGGAGLIGSIIYGRYANKYPLAILITPLVSLIICLCVLYFSTSSFYLIMILCLFWGASMTVIFIALQHKVIEAAPEATDIASSIHSAIYNIGIGGGAFIGGKVIIYSSLEKIGFVGAIFCIFSFLIFVFLLRKFWCLTKHLN